MSQDPGDKRTERAEAAPRRPSAFSYLFAILIVLGVGGYALTDWLVVTDREKIKAILQNARLCVSQRNVEGLRGLFTEDCRVEIERLHRFTGLKGFEVLEYARPTSRIGIRSVKVHPLKTIAQGSLIAETSRFSGQGERMSQTYHVTFEMRRFGETWKFRAVVIRMQ